MHKLVRLILALAVFAFSASLAMADNWTAIRLRGAVLQLVDGDWQRLDRDGVVPDTRVIRTLADGNVEFQRGQETVTIGPNTQIQIFDEKHAKPFTTVKQYFGTVSVEADVRNVEHFAVQTPYLAAVVKGTRFTVTSSKAGASVSVQRGHVGVSTKRHQHVTLSVGQMAAVSVVGGVLGDLVVSGRGILPKVTGGSTQSSAAPTSGDVGSGDDGGGLSVGLTVGGDGAGASVAADVGDNGVSVSVDVHAGNGIGLALGLNGERGNGAHDNGVLGLGLTL